MPLDFTRCRPLLQGADLGRLFIEELGWDRCAQSFTIKVNQLEYRLAAVAKKCGLIAYVCETPDGSIPDHSIRLKIDREITQTAFEHLLVFMDAKKSHQTWQWVKREPGRPTACRTHDYRSGQSGEPLLQKLQHLAVSLEEEEAGIGLPDITRRVRAAFDVERVTKHFYDRFKTEHAAFLDFIKGIPDDELQRWYASVMLNRLMFVYFIQKKGFLNGDPDYLRNKLAQTKREGKNRFYSDFLCPLFFEGFAKKAQNRSAATNQLLGKVPYLNGGIFQRHQIEEAHGETIRVADAAFDKLFDFFDQYRWHLDERPLRQDNEINPDVLGYIFEKYINQKQMGAYYTKEDITGYNSAYTIVPFLFEVARAKCKVAFDSSPAVSAVKSGTGVSPVDSSVWSLLHTDPDRYIYPAVKKGVELPLPSEIATGIKDVSKRTEWNKPAPAEYALPTEIWREVVARRRRYDELYRRLGGARSVVPEYQADVTEHVPPIQDINDFITYNLDIRQFAQDVIETSEPDLLSAFYAALKDVTILDPTCGSGAFLFAALNILYPLYEACLNRMALFVEEWQRTGSKAHPNYSKNFKAELARLEAHHNEPYFILKSIIVNNLYGVDIMDEAVEICKLRLFLKLVAQVESADDIEPLPDIDFNIRAGNTLVGYATYDEVKRAVTSKLDFDNAMAKIEDKAALLQGAFEMFRRQQTELGGEVTAADKRGLRQRLEVLEAELNRYLATDYGVEVGTPGSGVRSDAPAARPYQQWLHSHKPFHWFIEFYGIMKRGGFDVIIGNPPFVEYSKVRNSYTLRPVYRTLSCGNLYAMVLERCYGLVRKSGWVSLITPLSLVCTNRTEDVRALIRPFACWISCYDMRPSSLFGGVAQRLCILISQTTENSTGTVAVAGYRRWMAEERDSLIPLTRYVLIAWGAAGGPLSKFGLELEESVLMKIAGPPLEQFCSAAAETVYVHRIIRYFGKALSFLPQFKDAKGKRGKSEDYKEFRFDSSEQDQIVALLNTTMFYWFWRSHGDGFHCGYHDVYAMPYKKTSNVELRGLLKRLVARLMKHLDENSALKRITTKAGEITYQEFYTAASKPIIDEIDRALAGHYGLTAEELDFILNYDIKYRLGRNGGEGEE
jgi:hypothetical protein